MAVARDTAKPPLKNQNSSTSGGKPWQNPVQQAVSSPRLDAVLAQVSPSVAAVQNKLQRVWNAKTRNDREAAKTSGPQKEKATITNKNTGGRAVSYIGSGGAKETGTANTTPQVTPGTTPDWYAQQQKLYEQMYNEQVKANNAALEAARLRAQETTDAQIAALGEQYAGTNRQLYRDYMEQRRTLPQQMAAQGYSGGLSESSMLRLNNSYEEGLNENERARMAQETSYKQALSQQLYEAQARANEANQQAYQQWYGQRANVNEAIWKDQQQRAATMAAAGDFSEYKRMGYSDSEIAYLKQMWKRMNPQLQ